MEKFIEPAINFLVFAGLLWLLRSDNKDSKGTGRSNPHSFDGDPSLARDFASTGHGSHNPEWQSPSDSWQGSELDINPANGLPMVGGMGGFDVAGNTYGVDSTHDYSSSSFDDSFSSSCDGFSSSDFDSCSDFSSSDIGSCGGFSEW